MKSQKEAEILVMLERQRAEYEVLPKRKFFKLNLFY